MDEVGVGGMGRVYRAYDPKLRREVAIKRLRVAGKSAAVAQARMLREAQSMAKLSHPNVVPVYDVDVDDGSLFIAMEYVDGLTLRAWVDERRPDCGAILAVFLEAGEGLAAAHEQGIVHRDFKPANVIVGRDGRTRVMDFGLARLPDELPSSDSMPDTGESGRTASAAGHADITIYFMQGDHAKAVERYRHAIDIRRRLGMKNDLAAALGQLGRSLVSLERWEEAERAFEESDGLDAEAAASGRPRSAVAGLELGKLARRRGDLQVARERFETAWTFSRAGLDPRVQAEAALELGKLLWDLQVERERAHTLVRQALELATNAEGAAVPAIAAAARSWLETHPEPTTPAPSR